MKRLGELGEFGLIDLIRSRFEAPAGMVGIGDDCAVVPCGAVDMLVTTDMLIEGVHFLCSGITPEELGGKSVAVNLSDVAAMGGGAIGTFLSIALPHSTDAAWVERFIEGYKSVSDRYGVPLLGGDTTSSKSGMAINVAVLGSVAHGRAKLRSAAVAGDLVVVTGTLGDSGGGLKVILEGLEHDDDAQWLLSRHLQPTPRMATGAALGQLGGIHAMMDLSDGIASDLQHIVHASGVGAEIELDLLPLSPQLRRMAERYRWKVDELAAAAGEDYELLFTASASTPLPEGCTVVGRITEGSGLKWLRGGITVEKELNGFRHF